MRKDSIFRTSHRIQIGGEYLDLNRPAIMAILNITDDSFFAGSRINKDEALRRAGKLIEEGADILDIGGYSSRPGAKNIPVREELDRVIPVINTVRREFPTIPISVDTFRGLVAREALEAGANIVNDISAWFIDQTMLDTLVDKRPAYILMHMQGTPQTMQNDPKYQNIIQEQIRFFSEKINILTEFGIHDIIIDPGFGFGKTIAHNYELLSKLDAFNVLGRPILAGISRKGMLYKPLNGTAETALPATVAANVLALERGASILRVHDAEAAKQAVSVWELTLDQ